MGKWASLNTVSLSIFPEPIKSGKWRLTVDNIREMMEPGKNYIAALYRPCPTFLHATKLSNSYIYLYSFNYLNMQWSENEQWISIADWVKQAWVPSLPLLLYVEYKIALGRENSWLCCFSKVLDTAAIANFSSKLCFLPLDLWNDFVSRTQNFLFLLPIELSFVDGGRFSLSIFLWDLQREVGNTAKLGQKIKSYFCSTLFKSSAMICFQSDSL